MENASHWEEAPKHRKALYLFYALRPHRSMSESQKLDWGLRFLTGKQKKHAEEHVEYSGSNLSLSSEHQELATFQRFTVVKTK